MNKAAICGVCLSVMVAVPAMAAVNMLTNGSFESQTGTTITGWTNTGTTVVAGGSGGTTVDNYALSQSPDAAGANVDTFIANGNSIVSTTISLVKGTIYQIGYDVALYGSGSNTFSTTVLLGGSGLTALNVSSGGLTSTWTGVMTTYQATTNNATATLSIALTDSGSGKNLAVDRVYVSNIPEPSSMLLLLGGTAGLLRLRRRRRR